MQPRISLITLAVDDLERSLRFYRDGLGLPSEGIVGREFEHGAVAFFDLQGGLKLALWPEPAWPTTAACAARKTLRAPSAWRTTWTAVRRWTR
jgi:catechol 2,3-dioxygenase-like lactoylglutathione lyase family enzyme